MDKPNQTLSFELSQDRASRWPISARTGMFGRHPGAGIGAVATTVLLAASLIVPVRASAGTYPMYQCAPGIPAVSPGWSVFGDDTDATTVLSDTCSAGGSIGDYVFTNGQAGAVTENGSSGSQVGLELQVPESAPNLSVESMSAEVIASSVTGDDAFLGFASAGQELAGAVELPYGGDSNYISNDSWALPQGARDWEAFVNCSTDRSDTTCNFANSSTVPALTDITLTLLDNTPPTVTSVSGPLASAAAINGTVAGSQVISFTASDDSGVRSAALTLSPQSGAAATVHMFDFSAECEYDAWNACPVTQTVSGYTLNTAVLTNGTYAVALSVTDAAGNVTNDALGSVAIDKGSLLIN